MAIKAFDASGVDKINIDSKTFSNLAADVKIQDININRKSPVIKSVAETEELNVDDYVHKDSSMAGTVEFSNILKELIAKFPKIDKKQLDYYVNLYYVSFDVILGKYSLGEEREKMLTDEGYNYGQVQRMVNRIIDQLNQGYSFDSEDQIIKFLNDTINYDYRFIINKDDATEKKDESTGKNNFVQSFISILSGIIDLFPFFHGGAESSSTTIEKPTESSPQISVKDKELKELRKKLVEKGFAECENPQNWNNYFARTNEHCASFVTWVYEDTYYGDKSLAEISGLVIEEGEYDWRCSTGQLMKHFLSGENKNIDFYYNDSCSYYTGMNSDKLSSDTSIYVPKQGDFVFMQNDGLKWNGYNQEHTAMVKEVIRDENGNQSIVIIEGNITSGNMGNEFNERTLHLDDSQIIGYGTITNLP